MESQILKLEEERHKYSLERDQLASKFQKLEDLETQRVVELEQLRTHIKVF